MLKQFLKPSLLLLVIVLGLTVAGASQLRAVQPAASSPPTVEVIKANCQAAQLVLQQVQYSDVATRISRGRNYQSLTKLMATFNSRLAINKIDAGGQVSITADFEEQFNKFQNDYIKYSDQLEKIIELDCQSQPNTFYSQLETARDYRQEIAATVDSMMQLLDDYQNNVNQLATDMRQGSKS